MRLLIRSFKLICGIHTTDSENIKTTYIPPILSYAYVAEMPVMLEGSIVKNLLLGVRSSLHGRPPSVQDAWKVAERCGLDEEYLHAPETFNVGKSGRNLPMAARQAICIARGILTDPSVLMLQKPVAVLPPDMREKVFQLFGDFVKLGGLKGVLSGKLRQHSDGPLDYLLGRGTRTVVFTALDERGTPAVVDRVVYFEAEREMQTSSANEGEVRRHVAKFEAHNSRAFAPPQARYLAQWYASGSGPVTISRAPQQRLQRLQAVSRTDRGIRPDSHNAISRISTAFGSAFPSDEVL